MKTLYLECRMGAAGDMLTGALMGLLPESKRSEFIKKINSLGIPGVEISTERVSKCGISGTHISVKINGGEESEFFASHHGESKPEHEHEHEHGRHAHHHSGMRDIEHIVNDLPVDAKIKADILAVYALIAEAESAAHGIPVDNVHFHEVGTMDAAADITAVCLLMDMLKPEKVVASPIHVGSGQVECAHGILPVPAPATAFILRGVPIYGGKIDGELCTPTGAALLKYFVNDFGGMPIMNVENFGCGMGKNDFDPYPNCVRAFLGETEQSGDTVNELSCNLDDMTPEEIGFAAERLFEAGAKDVFTVPVGMKKSRPGTLLCVICAEADKGKMVKLIFRHTTTLGVRENISRRYTLPRRVETFSTELGELRVKKAEGCGVRREKYEYCDLARIAKENGLSLFEARSLLEKQKE